jgi:dTDP-4-amino-4,6-dideoxygalactose transaminase
VTSRHPELLRQVAILRNQGMEGGPGGLQFPRVGHNFRMTDVQAAILGAQLDRLEGFVAQRRRQAAWYGAELARRLPELELPLEAPGCRSNWQSYCVQLPEGVSQEAVLKGLESLGISARGSVGLAHVQAAYAWHRNPFPLPRSEERHRRSLMLPIFPGLPEEAQARVVEGLVQVLGGPGVRP